MVGGAADPSGHVACPASSRRHEPLDADQQPAPQLYLLHLLGVELARDCVGHLEVLQTAAEMPGSVRSQLLQCFAVAVAPDSSGHR